MACKIPLAEPKEKHYFQSYLVEGWVDVYFPIYADVSVFDIPKSFVAMWVMVVLYNKLKT